MRKKFTLKNSGSKINPSGYGWKFLYIWIISEICPTLKAIFIELLSEEMYVAWNSYGSKFFFSASLSEFRFTLFFWRHCPADYSMVVFFFTTEIWSNRRACDYKDRIKSVARGYKSQTILLRRSALVSSYLSHFP